jgi:hypothetical protein
MPRDLFHRHSRLERAQNNRVQHRAPPLARFVHFSPFKRDLRLRASVSRRPNALRSSSVTPRQRSIAIACASGFFFRGFFTGRYPNMR